MTPQEIFQAYAQERRAQEIEGLRLDVLPYFSRYTPVQPGTRGFITFNRIPPDEVMDQIREQTEYFTRQGCSFEWKVYDLDEPANLRELLEREGFAAEDPEAFMVYPLERYRPGGHHPVPGVRVVRVDSEAGVRDVLEVQRAIWEKDLAWLTPVLARRLREHPDQVSVYCAYAGEQPVGAGWIDFYSGSTFADLHGGAVLSPWRGRGIYSLLFDRRCQEARERGYRYLAVDASPMSRPILQKKGFEFVCWTYPLDSRG